MEPNNCLNKRWLFLSLDGSPTDFHSFSHALSTHKHYTCTPFNNWTCINAFPVFPTLSLIVFCHWWLLFCFYCFSLTLLKIWNLFFFSVNSWVRSLCFILILFHLQSFSSTLFLISTYHSSKDCLSLFWNE